MQSAIGPDQERKILILTVVSSIPGGSGHIEDSLRVFQQGVHTNYLSAAILEISEEIANRRSPQIV